VSQSFREVAVREDLSLSKVFQGYPNLSKPIQAILGKKRLFIFFQRKVMQGKVAVRQEWP
jgi:hypothetical protein